MGWPWRSSKDFLLTAHNSAGRTTRGQKWIKQVQYRSTLQHTHTLHTDAVTHMFITSHVATVILIDRVFFSHPVCAHTAGTLFVE